MTEKIEFSEIVETGRVPGPQTEYNSSLANQGLPANARKIVVLGQKTSAGTGTDNVIYKTFSSADFDTYTGVGSQAALCGKALYKTHRNVDVSVVGIPDAAGTPAAGTITVANIPTTSGNIEFWIGNVYVQVAVESGDAVNDIAAAINTALQAKQHLMSMTFGVSDAVVTGTARNDGTHGNDVSIAYKNNGITTTTFTVVQPVSGATDSDITAALAAILPGDFNVIISCLNDATNLALLKTHLNTLSSPTEGRPAIGVYGYVGVQATIETLAGTTMNSKHMIVGYLPYTDTTENGHSLICEIAGSLGALMASQPNQPSKPFNTLPLLGIAAPHIDNRLTRTEQESCFENGVTPLVVNASEVVTISRAISNYTLNAASVPDGAYLDINTILCLNRVRFVIEFMERNLFSQQVVTDRTQGNLKSLVIAELYKLETELTVEHVKENQDLVLVYRNSSDASRFDVQIPADIVTGAHKIANRIDLFL